MISKVLFFCYLLTALSFFFAQEVAAANSNPYWEIQSVDTMKLSRDSARQMLYDSNADSVIEGQVNRISDIGATHVAIATPYDPEFIPVMKKWVEAARNYGLNVWFRGNLSGWEGWFGYSAISKDTHEERIRTFIFDNAELFESGDIFTPCPECENGGIGDPRSTGDVIGFRNFLISEYKNASDAFDSLGKDIKVGYFSMNGDVAELVMDKETTQALGNIVVFDHYVKTPEQLVKDIDNLAILSGGKVVLGEIGVPIPDIHGFMTESEQEQWLKHAFSLLVKSSDLVGINYWTASHSSTELWSGNGNAKQSVFVLSDYYQPKLLTGTLVNEVEIPIVNAEVSADSYKTVTDENGNFTLHINPVASEIVIKADTYSEFSIAVNEINSTDKIVLKKTEEGMLFKILRILYSMGYRFN